jgi:hypothetical protein
MKIQRNNNCIISYLQRKYTEVLHGLSKHETSLKMTVAILGYEEREADKGLK